MTQENVQTVIIAGAGPAGLTAACFLLRHKGYRVIILEESFQTGGISRTEKYKGNRMDIGGHRFFTKVDSVNDFWQSLMPMQGKPAYDAYAVNVYRKHTFTLCLFVCRKQSICIGKRRVGGWQTVAQKQGDKASPYLVARHRQHTEGNALTV